MAILLHIIHRPTPIIIVIISIQFIIQSPNNRSPPATAPRDKRRGVRHNTALKQSTLTFSERYRVERCDKSERRSGNSRSGRENTRIRTAEDAADTFSKFIIIIVNIV